jgi:hypothetical protein
LHLQIALRLCGADVQFRDSKYPYSPAKGVIRSGKTSACVMISHMAVDFALML